MHEIFLISFNERLLSGVLKEIFDIFFSTRSRVWSVEKFTFENVLRKSFFTNQQAEEMEEFPQKF
jgi:hypothetical protein